MNIIERAKRIILSPKTEWLVIDSEQKNSTQVLTTYLILLAIIPAIGNLIGYGLVGYRVIDIHIGLMNMAVRQAVTSFVGIITGAYISAFILTWLAPKFASTESFDKAFQLVAYSYTPMCVAGILYIIPSLSGIAVIFGLYGLYILYLGIAPMMKTPEDKVTSYFLTSIVFVIIVSILISLLLGALFILF